MKISIDKEQYEDLVQETIISVKDEFRDDLKNGSKVKDIDFWIEDFTEDLVCGILGDLHIEIEDEK